MLVNGNMKRLKEQNL